VEILERRPRGQGSVFPSPRPRTANAGKTAMSGCSRVKTRLAEAMGNFEPFLLHDLRRTAATQMAEIGIAPQVEKVLNHKSSTIRGVAAIYNRHEYRAEQREALPAWEQRLREIVGAAESASAAPWPTDVAENSGGTARAGSEPLSVARTAV
jgi:integrase